MKQQPEERRERAEMEKSAGEPARSFSQRATKAWHDLRDAPGARATLIKIALILVLGWLLAGAIQQLAIIALVLFALWLVFDVVRRNILR